MERAFQVFIFLLKTLGYAGSRKKRHHVNMLSVCQLRRQLQCIISQHCTIRTKQMERKSFTKNIKIYIIIHVKQHSTYVHQIHKLIRLACAHITCP